MQRNPLSRRHIVHAAVAVGLAAGWPMLAAAQEGKPIEWIVGYAAGGGSEIEQSGLKLVHVPYSGAAPAVQACSAARCPAP